MMETNKHTLKLEKIIEIISWPIVLIILLFINSAIKMPIAENTELAFTGLVLTIALFYYYLTYALLPLTKRHFLKNIGDIIFLGILLFLALQTKSYTALLLIIPLASAAMIFESFNALLIAVITALALSGEILFENLNHITISFDPILLIIILPSLIILYSRLIAQKTFYEKRAREDAQLKLAAASERLSHLESHGKEFPTLAAQQIFTPLATIQSFVQTLQSEQDGKLSTKQKNFVNETFKYVEKMHKLIKELLYISRIEFAQTAPLKPTDAQTILKSTIERYTPQANESKITLNLNLPSEHLPNVLADKNSLPDIFARIIDNAIRYSPPEAAIEISQQIFHKDDGAHLYTEIKDHGYGIPLEEQKYLFRKFFRGTNIIDKYPNGNGLSLYIVKLLLDQQNGKIHYKSKTNEGSTFQIDLPVVPPKTA